MPVLRMWKMDPRDRITISQGCCGRRGYEGPRPLFHLPDGLQRTYITFLIRKISTTRNLSFIIFPLYKYMLVTEYCKNANKAEEGRQRAFPWGKVNL